MKKNKQVKIIIIIVTLSIISFFMLKYNSNFTKNDKISQQIEYNSNTIEQQIKDENGTILINSIVSLPKSLEQDEFSENFNAYYQNIESKTQDYLKFEGYDLAEQEKILFNDFNIIEHNQNFEVTYKDENIISIKRTTNIISNEKETSNIVGETFKIENGTFVLISDISADIISVFEELTDEKVVDFEKMYYYIDENGINIIYGQKNQYIEFDKIMFSDEYKFLGEK